MKKTIILTIFLSIIFVACSSSLKTGAFQLSKNSEKENKILLQDSIINYGSKFLRTPYRYGGISPKGFDCSGFTSYVFKEFGYQLNRSSRDQAKQFPEVKRKDLQKGDLVFFTGRRINGVVGHVGIVSENLGNGEFQFLHASVSKGVIFSKSNEPYYASRYLKAGRPIAANNELPILLSKENVVKSELEREQTSYGNQSSASNMRDALYHIVRKGETLSKISMLYDVPISTIMSLNNLNSKRIKQGQKLLILEAVSKPQIKFSTNFDSKPSVELLTDSSDSTVISTTTNNEVFDSDLSVTVHTVTKGESLYSISRKYGCTIDQLKTANNLNTNNIKIGQRLNIP